MSSSFSEEGALEYNMSEDLEDSPAVTSPPPLSTPQGLTFFRLNPCVGRAWQPVRGKMESWCSFAFPLAHAAP
ncbi:hypothetical protein AVEN_228335-1 [Araneus ventricosus]|uniref:Uncharacterized protein n=1 Tax=Araneus ventricosus TaxID=182803 RepID=A0A4Y2K620_ARAVE|nr:hypothetical protein AVEN_228335-1 [Araneus ventricosus]